MFNFLKFEIRGFMSKKVFCNIALCALLMFCGCVKTNKEYLELKNGRIENLQIMKVDEQNHINILKYDLSQQYDKEKEKELQYWYLQIDYTDALENAYVKNDNLEILKKRIQRNKHVLYGLNKNYLSPFTDSFVPNKKSLKSDIAMDEFNLKNNQLDVVDQQKPTFCFYLKNIQCKSIFTAVIFLLILLINADIWSKEFSSTKPYQYIFSYPLSRKCILLIRNMFYCIISLLLIVSFTAVLCFVGYIQYGYGGHLFILTNGSFLEIIHVLLKSFLIFMSSLLMYVQFIQLLSLVLKDEIITWFAVIMISLVSCFVITGWNPFSYILSFDIDFYYGKALFLSLINLLIPFISCVFIENMDFE